MNKSMDENESESMGLPFQVIGRHFQISSRRCPTLGAIYLCNVHAISAATILLSAYYDGVQLAQSKRWGGTCNIESDASHKIKS